MQKISTLDHPCSQRPHVTPLAQRSLAKHISKSQHLILVQRCYGTYTFWAVDWVEAATPAETTYPPSHFVTIRTPLTNWGYFDTSAMAAPPGKTVGHNQPLLTPTCTWWWRSELGPTGLFIHHHQHSPLLAAHNQRHEGRTASCYFKVAQPHCHKPTNGASLSTWDTCRLDHTHACASKHD